MVLNLKWENHVFMYDKGTLDFFVKEHCTELYRADEIFNIGGLAFALPPNAAYLDTFSDRWEGGLNITLDLKDINIFTD